MNQYDNTNRGVLFKNDRKQSDRHPDYNGSITLANGEEHWLSAWIKRDKNGKHFMSLSIGDLKQPREQPNNSGWNAPATPEPPDFDDSVPF